MELFKLLGKIAVDNDSANKAIDETTDKAEKSGGKVSSFFSKVGGTVAKASAVVGGAAVAVGGAVVAVTENTREYRTEMAKLETAFTTAGHSTKAARDAYSDLQSILGETDQAVEAANHLAKLTDNEKDLQTWTNICTGVFATFGDSLPIEGLTEAANETAKVGTVTGSLADALNWAGVNEDAFNEQLAGCSTEQERQALIMETLNGLYSNASEEYKKANADVIEHEKAQQRLTDVMAKIGEVAEPVITAFTGSLASLGEKAVPIIEKAGDVVADFLGKFQEGDYEGIADMGIQIVQNLLDGFAQNIGSVVSKGTELIGKLSEGISSALPTLIPAAVGAVIALATALLSSENITTLINSALIILQALADGLLAALPMLTEAVPEIILALTTTLLDGNNIGKIIESGMEVNMALTEGLLDAIPELLAALPEIIFAIANTLMGYDWISLGKKMLESYIKGITSVQVKVKNVIKSILDANVKVYSAAYDKINSLTGGAFSKIVDLWKKNINLASDFVTAGLNRIVDSFNSKIDNAKRIVEDGLNLIKGLFNFTWSLPPIKLPHFKISPAGWKFADLLQGSIPKLGIDWYAKGGVLEEPTIFGINGNRLMAGGEAGAEAVAPIDVLQGYMAEAVASQNAQLVAVLEKILEAITTMDGGMPESIAKALTENVKFKLNEREVGRVVRSYA